MGTYPEYKQHMQKIADVKNTLAVLQWDQETYLPAKGAAFRGQQIATLSELIHQLSTDKNLGDILENLQSENNLSESEKKNVSLSYEDYNKQKKYTPSFVRSMTETISKSFHSWIKARKENSFAVFEKDLSELIELKKQETDILGYSAHPYDALLDEFEKGCTVQLLDKTFTEVRPSLKNLLDQITTQKQVDDSFLYQHFPKQDQWNYGIYLIDQLGFDKEAGRQDISEHPFTTSFNKNDVRITTRVNENDFNNMTWSCIHETGHALYEQGLAESEYGLPCGEYASLSIHESQSRLWENNIGRSSGFWKYQYPTLKQYFPEQFKKTSLENFYKGINKVVPSFIRTEADELTYHFHVMIRYELEKKLIEGTLTTHDIPAYWNEQYLKYLDVNVPDDMRGCLQDVHWSHGSFGYFATYSLGSFYAAQLFAAAKKQIPDLNESIENGNTAPLLKWLRNQIHQFGRMYTSEELCMKASGEVLNIGYFMQYVIDKYSKIYEF
ncbi:MAG: carboxypeptidase M32 [Bacteroidetes bacterium]|nr:carboxypeptidase M32 [Bacteroidota bacterium]